MSANLAHDLNEKDRTEDIKINENVEFSAMLLSENVRKGLLKSGYEKPSPIQLKAIPLGRCGFDLVLKAKSGTGKTAVFVITALEMINVSKKSVQVVILAPTREIAVQIQNVFKHIGYEFKGLGVEYFIGGTPMSEDEAKILNCHIVVGAPGRVKHLIEKNILDVSEVRLFVMDEADKLMDTGFQPTINWIYNKLPKRKQVIAASATYPDDLDKFLTRYMLSPTQISPDSNIPVLLGIRQFYSVVKPHLNNIQQMKYKTENLTKILSNLSFNQCLVFSNYQTRAESLSNNLNQQGWPSKFISGHQNQSTRLQAVDDLKKFKCRILSSTDLTSRGIDAANVDLVINYDVPIDVETYLHRMGRAGRFGSYGICITIAADDKDVIKLKKIIKKLGNNVSVAKLPETMSVKDIWHCDLSSMEQLYAYDTEDEDDFENTSTNIDKSSKLDQVDQEKSIISENNPLSLYSNNNDDTINLALRQLSDLLSKPYAGSINENDIKNINNLLVDIKSKFSQENSETFKEILTLDNKMIVEKLSTGNFLVQKNENNHQQDKQCKKSNNTTKSESKKSKMTETEPIPQESSQIFNKEASNFQQNMLLRKNIALFAITKLIMENKFCDMLMKDCSKEIANLLEIITEQDSIQMNTFTLTDINTFLQSHNIASKFCNQESSANVISHSKYSKTSCECAESVFSSVYDYSIATGSITSSSITSNWRENVCSKHNLKDKLESKDHKHCNETAIFDSGEFDLNTLDIDFEDSVSVSKAERDHDNIFSKAYDKAIQNSNQKQSNTEKDQETICEPFGFAVDNNYSKNLVHFQQGMDKTSDKSTQSSYKRHKFKEQSYVSPELQNYIERRNIYTSYYQHYSNVLAETAPTFTNVNDFRIWFGKWKEEVEAVRDFVQQDIFQNECDKYKN